MGPRRRDAVAGTTTEFDARLQLPQPPVNLAGIAEQQLLALRLSQRRAEGEPRVVKIPVRIVGREQDAVPTDPLEQIDQLHRLGRLFHRLAS